MNKRSFSKTLFKPEKFVNGSFALSRGQRTFSKLDLTYAFSMYCVSVINALLHSVRENKEELKLNDDDILSLAKKYGVS